MGNWIGKWMGNMKTRIFLLTFLLLSGCESPGSHNYKAHKHDAHSANPNASVVVSDVTSIYDGDTFRVNIDNYPAIIGVNMPVRVLGIDTPEIRGKCQSEKDKAKEARLFTVNQLTQAKRIELVNIQRGKYFRLLAVVLVDGVSLADNLIERGLAVEYDGGRKKDWCEI